MSTYTLAPDGDGVLTIWTGDTNTNDCQPVLVRTDTNAVFFDDAAAALTKEAGMRECPVCQGHGELYAIDPHRHVTDPDYVTAIHTCRDCGGTGVVDGKDVA